MPCLVDLAMMIDECLREVGHLAAWVPYSELLLFFVTQEGENKFKDVKSCEMACLSNQNMLNGGNSGGRLCKPTNAMLLRL